MLPVVMVSRQGKLARFINANVVLDLGETNIRTYCLLLWCPDKENSKIY